MWSWWQHIPANLDPVLFEIGSFQMRYYGLMYIVAFVITYGLMLYRIKREEVRLSEDQLSTFFMYTLLGVILGGRLGYVLFYNLGYFINHPLEIFLPFDVSNGFAFTGIAGMSYHGGVIGVVIAGLAFSQRQKINFWKMADLVVPAIPLGYTFGRLGNFINGELYGRITDVPWGMYFPAAPTYQLRHPSQLYEAFFEGILLFLILWTLRNKPSMEKLMLPLYLIGYGIARFFIEFVREPDAHLGYVLGPFTMGQVLCLGMILIGAILIVLKGARKEEPFA